MGAGVLGQFPWQFPGQFSGGVSASLGASVRLPELSCSFLERPGSSLQFPSFSSSVSPEPRASKMPSDGSRRTRGLGKPPQDPSRIPPGPSKIRDFYNLSRNCLKPSKYCDSEYFCPKIKSTDFSLSFGNTFRSRSINTWHARWNLSFCLHSNLQPQCARC